MSLVLDALFWVLRRGPVGLGVVALAILGFGYFIQIEQEKGHVRDAQALVAGPPAAVDIGKFNRDTNMTEWREAVIRGQGVMDDAYRLTIEGRGRDDEAFMVPLVSSTSSDAKTVIGIAFFEGDGFGFDDLTPEFLNNGLIGFGDVGPITEYNGRISSLGKWDDLTEEAFEERGLRFSNDLVVIWPYINGRDAEFAPPSDGVITTFGLFSAIAGAVGLLALAKLVIGKKSKKTAPAAQAATVMHPADAQAPRPDPQSDDMPLWQPNEAGQYYDPFADPNAPPPEPFAPPPEVDAPPLEMDAPLPDAVAPQSDPSAEPTLVPTPAPRALTRGQIIAQKQAEAQKLAMAQQPVIEPKRSGFGARKALIGIVAGLFFLGLGTTIFTLLSETWKAEVAAAPAPTVQEIVVGGVADIIVPDADPDRHWTQIDVSPIYEWVVAQGLLAAQGDVDARITVGLMIGGLLLFLFMIRFFFAMRRSLKPKEKVRFDDIGIN